MEQALKIAKEKYPQDIEKFEVRWRPFELNPGLPKGGEGLNKIKMYHEKFGKQRFEASSQRLKQAGEPLGIFFSYGGNVGNTFDSHRLVWWAYEKGQHEMQDKVIDSIFKAYFEEEKCLSDVNVLKECAERAGFLDGANELFFSDDSDGDKTKGVNETIAEMKEFRQFTSGGVPLFIFNKKYCMSGAQEKETFIEVFEEIIRQESKK